MNLNLTVLLIVASCSWIVSVFALSPLLQLEIRPEQTRCIGQELDQEDAAIWRFGAGVPSAKDKGKEFAKEYAKKAKLIATITDPQGGTVMHDKIAIGMEHPREVRVNVNIRGVYELCFDLTSSDETPVRVYFGVDFKSRKGGFDPSKKIEKENIPTLEAQLKAAEETLSDVSREIEFARAQELLLREASETTTERIQWFGILSMAILLITSLWQIVYLRHFFASKKLL